MTVRVAIDIGGTFTDIVIADAQAGLSTYKIINEPAMLGRRVDECIRDALGTGDGAVPAGAVAAIIHGTTTCSNAVLEGTGARTGLVCTKGFRDLLEIKGGRRPPVNDVFWEPIPPLVPREWRLEVAERTIANGSVTIALDEQEVRAAGRELAAQGVDAVAVGFLHAHSNPSHERRAMDILREELPDAWLCASHDVLPEIREYPRTSTTVVNAYLMPTVNRYLGEFEAELRHYDRPILIMQSNGGVMTSAHARRYPVRMLESGPAAGVLAAARLARALDLPRAVAFDMGGTTVKACLIEEGEAAEAQDSEVGAGANGAHGKGAGHLVRVPGFDIVEIGAGGGSIASLDRGMRLRVGPESAASVPGPACYGRGGDRPTVTDANVVLGYMNPQAIAGGTVPIDAAAAGAVIQRQIGDPLGMDLATAAHGIHQVANATMTRAVRAVTSERGRDPRDYTLIAFGGAGPIHAAALAEGIGIEMVYVPLLPGLFSAVGLQFASQTYDRVRSVFMELGPDSGTILRTIAAELRAELAEIVGHADAELHYEIKADLRYTRQALELAMPLPDVEDEALAEALAAGFHRAHARNFGYDRPDAPVSVTGLRCRVTLPSADAGIHDVLHRGHRKRAVAAGGSATRHAWFGPVHGLCEAALIPREALAGRTLPGPAIVEEYDTTIVVPPGWEASLDRLFNVVLRYIGEGEA